MLCADKSYDSDELQAHIQQASCFNSITQKQNTKAKNSHTDWHLYKARHLIEDAFSQLKTYRAVPTRFDKLKQSYENTMIALACETLW